jgi:hypothetical protein
MTVPAMVASRDADSVLRVLADYAHFSASARRAAARPSHLLADEFATIDGVAGPPSTCSNAAAAPGPASPSPARAAPPSVPRTSGPGCWPPPQPSCCSGPEPSELAALAGTERVAEGLAGRRRGAEQPADDHHAARARVDQDAVRQLPTGEADLIVRSLAERVRMFRTRVPAKVKTVAQSLTALP